MSEGLDETLDSGLAKPTELAAGAHLGKYRLERILGSGGMGVVWAAHDPDLERKVAIKVLRRADAGPALRTRLLREARAMARLKHPNVLTVYEVGSDGDRDFIAMELVDGASMDSWLDARPPADEVWQAVMAAGRGLAAAHAAGLVHRDFKPHNVLRSKDGRILVTDFGLARGSGEDGPGVALDSTIDVALDTTHTPRQTDNVLDSTLTQPGQLIGTPAYMAPEQYAGAAPDPRTDQFAFCVTAWQAITGERPFEGRTIDELRKAALAGIGGKKAKMPRGVRAVLARGLSVDPAARWADLEALLAALERDVRRRKLIGAAVWSVCGTIVVIAALAGIQLALGAGKHKAEPIAHATGCAAPDHEFDEAWTPERRATLAARYGNSAGFTRAADLFDKLRTDWIGAYTRACTDQNTASLARQSCLRGERDEAATYSRLLDTIPTNAVDAIDFDWGLLPHVYACDGPSPVTPPLLPEDHKLRDRIVALRVQLAMSRFGAPGQILKDVDKLRSEARAIPWLPLEAEIEQAAGVDAQVANDFDAARSHLESAIKLAESNHAYRVEATSRIALYEVEASASAHPGEPGREKRLYDEALAAVERAGGDAALLISIETINNRVLLDRLQLDAAIAGSEATYQQALAHKAPRQAAISAAYMIDAQMRRDHAGDLDDAWKLGTELEKLVADIPMRRGRDPLAHSMAELAWRRGDLDDAHARFDKRRHPLAPAGGIELTGTVAKPDGSPAAGATVVAWQGELSGDGKRVYTRGDFEGEVVTCDDRGAFTVHAAAGGAVIAELGDARSLPVHAQDRPIAIALAPTRAVTGTVHTDAPGDIDVEVQFLLGDATWSVATAVARDGGFRLTGVPAGGELVAQRDGHMIIAGAARELTWPKGSLVDVIVRGGRRDVAVVMLRGHHDARTPAAVLAIANANKDLAAVPASVIGLGNETDIGAHDYQPGDLHAVIRDVAPGDITACAVSTETATCTTASAPANGQLAMTIVQK